MRKDGDLRNTYLQTINVYNLTLMGCMSQIITSVYYKDLIHVKSLFRLIFK